MERSQAAGPPVSDERPRAAEFERIRAAVSSPAALWVAAIWAAAEASLFFVVPDAWLGLVALYAPRRMPVTLLAIVCGALVGAALLFLLSLAAGPPLTALLADLPGILAGDLDQARAELAAQGLPAFLNGPVQGLPVKLYVHAAALGSHDLGTVMLGTALNRIMRIGLFGLVMAAVGLAGRPVLRRWPRACALAYVIGWAIFYLVFWAVRGD